MEEKGKMIIEGSEQVSADMPASEEKKTGGMTRRKFLRDAGLVVSSVAASAIAGCKAETPREQPTKAAPVASGGTPVVKEVVKEVPVTVNGIVPPALEPEETIVKCIGPTVATDVKNGKIVRLRPLHYDAQYPNLKPWTYEARGKKFTAYMKSSLSPHWFSYKNRVYSPNRILYPLKRVDWEPGGDPAKINAQNRGKSKYKRISWDEATTIVANEIKRIIAKYGPAGICVAGAPHGEAKTIHSAHNVHAAFLHYWLINKYGKTFTEVIDTPVSWEGSAWGAKHFWGHEAGQGEEVPSDTLQDISKNAEVILVWGEDNECNQWRSNMLFGQMALWMKELGVKLVYVNPDLNNGAAIHASKWIPVRPNHDPALQLAIAYTWLTEGTYEKDYLATHSVGFDKFEAYVMGKEDGVPKTPAWAAPLCGVPEWTIKALARVYAKKLTSVMHRHGGGMKTGLYSHEAMRLNAYLLGMQGWGKPGRHQYGSVSVPSAAKAPNLTSVTTTAYEERGIHTQLLRQNKTPVPAYKDRQMIIRSRFTEAILNPPVTYYSGYIRMPRQDQFVKATYPKEGFSPVHMFWGDAPCISTQCSNGGCARNPVWKSPSLEFVMFQHPWMEDACTSADIILPSNTKYEEYDIGSASDFYNVLSIEKQAIQPVGESKSDYEIVTAIAKKLDYEKEWTFGKSVSDMVKEGFDKSGLADQISWEDINKKGYFVQGPRQNWESGTPASLKFYEDPKKNPLQTPSGLLEYESVGLKENFPNDKERPPVAHFVQGGSASEGWTHDESPFGERAKKYPLQCMTGSPRWRYHAQFDDITWMREIPSAKVKGHDGYLYEPVWLNPKDAEKRGIVGGDICKVYNERGTILCGAIVNERMMEEVTMVKHGSRPDWIIPGQIDRGGSASALTSPAWTSKNVPGQFLTGFLVQVEKVSGNEMDEWRKKYPEAFARAYDPASGLRFEAWVVS